MKNKFKTKSLIFYLSLIAIGGLAGYLISTSAHQHIEPSPNQHIESSENQIWTCSMHPQIRKTEPGKCPLCGMDLIPLNTDESGSNPMAIQMSPTAMKLANVQTTIVGNQKPEKEIRLNGKVQPDERMVVSQSSHIPGRIEQLQVNFTGEFVQKAQTLATIYSPDLVMAQEELFEASKIKNSQPALYEAAREKLKNWKLTDKQINHLLTSEKKLENFPVTADVSGVVLSKNVNLGDYIQRGQTIYQIADLSKVWVLFDVYESDMTWIDKGDTVEFTVQSLPGEKFSAAVSFIDRVINPKTRVAQARVEMKNKGLKLKPEMFVSGVITSPLETEKEALVVPKSAVMWTGERSVVYVKGESEKGVLFTMREVTLGPALGDSYVIASGLETGEEIATKGTFSIDAAAQLSGKPSMMSPEGGAAMTGHDHGSMPEATDKHQQADAKMKHLNFRVSGNCGMCKDRIEGSLKGVEGIVSGNWDIDSKMMHVQYDPGKISEMEIHKRIAAVGHDTEKVKADIEVYDELPGCCQYPKEHDN